MDPRTSIFRPTFNKVITILTTPMVPITLSWKVDADRSLIQEQPSTFTPLLIYYQAKMPHGILPNAFTFQLISIEHGFLSKFTRLLLGTNWLVRRRPTFSFSCSYTPNTNGSECFSTSMTLWCTWSHWLAFISTWSKINCSRYFSWGLQHLLKWVHCCSCPALSSSKLSNMECSEAVLFTWWVTFLFNSCLDLNSLLRIGEAIKKWPMILVATLINQSRLIFITWRQKCSIVRNSKHSFSVSILDF